MMNNKNLERANSLLFSILVPLAIVTFILAALPAMAAPFAYVANGDASTVSVIDTTTNKVLGTPISVGIPGTDDFPNQIAITPDGRSAFVSLSRLGDDTVEVIDTTTNAVVTTFDAGGARPYIAFSPDGNRTYLAVRQSRHSSIVDVLDTVSFEVIDQISVLSATSSVAISPTGNPAYVTTTASMLGHVLSSALKIVDTEASTVLGDPFNFPGASTSIGITPDGSSLYLGGSKDISVDPSPPSDFVSVFSTGANSVLATIPLTARPSGIAITPDGLRAYIALVDGKVYVIDTITNNVVQVIDALEFKGAVLSAIALTPSGDRAYVTDLAGNSVWVIDTASNTVSDTPIPVDSGPVSVAISPVLLKPFNRFKVKQLHLAKSHQALSLLAKFSLSTKSDGMNLDTDSVTVELNTLKLSFPLGSFKKVRRARVFYGNLNGTYVGASLKSMGRKKFKFRLVAYGEAISVIHKPVTVRLTIGADQGTAIVESKKIARMR